MRVKTACESGEASREKGGKGTQPHVEKVGLVHAFLYLYTYIYIARCLSVRSVLYGTLFTTCPYRVLWLCATATDEVPDSAAFSERYAFPIPDACTRLQRRMVLVTRVTTPCPWHTP